MVDRLVPDKVVQFHRPVADYILVELVVVDKTDMMFGKAVGLSALSSNQNQISVHNITSKVVINKMK